MPPPNRRFLEGPNPVVVLTVEGALATCDPWMYDLAGTPSVGMKDVHAVVRVRIRGDSRRGEDSLRAAARMAKYLHLGAPDDIRCMPCCALENVGPSPPAAIIRRYHRAYDDTSATRLARRFDGVVISRMHVLTPCAERRI